MCCTQFFDLIMSIKLVFFMGYSSILFAHVLLTLLLLFDLFVICMGVTVATELFNFKSTWSIFSIFFRSVTWNTIWSFIFICTTIHTFKRNNNSWSLRFSHKIEIFRFNYKYVFLHIQKLITRFKYCNYLRLVILTRMYYS